MKLENIEMIPIWGEKIPGNTGASKLDVMNVDLTMTMDDIFSAKGGLWDKSTDEITNTVADHTMVWMDEVLNGYAKETFDDVPFLIPYLVEGSKQAVISCPGGAYLGKSLEGEGKDIAEFLNAAGISCFVLWYRSAPYQSPYMFLDLQRAIRFVRYHAKEYGIDPNQISTIGFSAGGNLNAVTAACFGNKPVVEEGYIPDEIDAVDAQANAVAMCYPAVSVENDKILSILFGLEAYNDKTVRMQKSDGIEMIKNIKADMPPMFLCAAQDDDVVPVVHLTKFATRAIELGVPTELHLFPYGGHGFGGCIEHMRPPFAPKPNFSAVIEWKELYVKWLKRQFS